MDAKLMCYRDQAGLEVDVVIEAADGGLTAQKQGVKVVTFGLHWLASEPSIIVSDKFLYRFIENLIKFLSDLLICRREATLD